MAIRPPVAVYTPQKKREDSDAEHQPTRDSQCDGGRRWTRGERPAGQRSDQEAGELSRRHGLNDDRQGGRAGSDLPRSTGRPISRCGVGKGRSGGAARQPETACRSFFEAGNTVLVRYREENGRNHALNIERVGSAGPAVVRSGPVADRGRESHVGLGLAHDDRQRTVATSPLRSLATLTFSRAAPARPPKRQGQGTPLTTFVHSGDTVSVTTGRRPER